MSLIKSKSKKAFEQNIKTEMSAGKPQDQSLAIAYNVKRKAKRKKMAMGGEASASYDPKAVPKPPSSSDAATMAGVFKAEGGMIASAASERRPMPDNRHNDAKMASKNSGKKPAKKDGWLDKSTVMQSQAKDSRKVMPIKHPRMVASDAFSTRLRDEEDDLQASEGVNDGLQHQPSEQDNEEEPNRQGPSTPSLKMKMMAEGGEVDERERKASHEMKYASQDRPVGVHRGGDGEGELKGRSSAGINAEWSKKHKNPNNAQHALERSKEFHSNKLNELKAMPNPNIKGLYEGGAVSEKAAEEDHAEHPAGLESDDDQMQPSMSDYMDEHDAAQYAEGGDIYHEMDEQPMDEEEEDHHDSIAAAIMARKRYAEGGSVYNGDDSLDSDDSDQADLRRNAEEDANMEDQSSFNAMRKENYSESEGLDTLDQPHNSNLKGDSREDDESDPHDMVSAIRSKMNMRRQFR